MISEAKESSTQGPEMRYLEWSLSLPWSCLLAVYDEGRILHLEWQENIFKPVRTGDKQGIQPRKQMVCKMQEGQREQNKQGWTVALSCSFANRGQNCRFRRAHLPGSLKELFVSGVCVYVCVSVCAREHVCKICEHVCEVCKCVYGCANVCVEVCNCAHLRIHL